MRHAASSGAKMPYKCDHCSGKLTISEESWELEKADTRNYVKGKVRSKVLCKSCGKYNLRLKAPKEKENK